MSITVFGIPNCDTVKKARNWLDGRGVVYTFHDYKKAGAPAQKLESWCDALGWETVLNRAGTTFKKLPEEIRSTVDQKRAIALMIDQPSMIKRPLVEYPGGLLLGFKPGDWETAFGR
jgi:arsenate reductase (glutaredoxin)